MRKRKSSAPLTPLELRLRKHDEFDSILDQASAHFLAGLGSQAVATSLWSRDHPSTLLLQTQPTLGRYGKYVLWLSSQRGFILSLMRNDSPLVSFLDARLLCALFKDQRNEGEPKIIEAIDDVVRHLRTSSY